MISPFRINLGGEGEVPGVLNQLSPRTVTDPTWRSSRTGQTFAELVAAGHEFLIWGNLHLPVPDGTVDEVITNNMPPVDRVNYLGPTVQSSEIRRILKTGGVWTNDGNTRFVKP